MKTYRLFALLAAMLITLSATLAFIGDTAGAPHEQIRVAATTDVPQ
jgi:hypothetical protein